MGTNYYKVKPLDESTKAKIIEAIKENDFYVIEEDTLSFEFPISKTEIHIGKRSGGWKFLFDHNNWNYFNKSEESLVNWINDPTTGVIRDEYGDDYTSEQFWEEIVNPTYTDDKWDSTTYYQAHPSEGLVGSGSDFYLGKYRIATSTDFV